MPTTPRTASRPTLGTPRARALGSILAEARKAAESHSVQVLAVDHDPSNERAWRTVWTASKADVAQAYADTHAARHKIPSGRIRIVSRTGMSQAAVADALGIDQSSVSLWEAGLSCPDMGRFLDVLTILGLDHGEVTRTIAAVPKEDGDLAIDEPAGV